MIVVLDFGSQYSHLICRRIREHGVYSESLPYSTPWEKILSYQPEGIVLSGGPASVCDPSAPHCAPDVFASGIPVLGICYGLQLMVRELGGDVKPAKTREYGPARLHVVGDSEGLFRNTAGELDVWMSHGDRVERLPNRFRSIATTASSPYAAITNDQGLIALQFHPEVRHTPLGHQIIENFLFEICTGTRDWTPSHFISDTTRDIQAKVGSERVICALSGGVDSMVAAALLSKAIGTQLICIFVDTGLLRKNEGARLQETFDQILLNQVIHVDAGQRFLKSLNGLVDPEAKRKAIGHEFIRVFSDEARKLGDIKFLAQGTLYPDVIESTSHETQAAAKIKTHHNVGGLPKDLHFSLVEPLRYLFKDEVRKVGLDLGLPKAIVERQPFPGPGLAVRILGEVTPDRIAILQEADAIVETEIRSHGWYEQLWQSFAVLTPLQTVGVMGDDRTYSNVVALRAVTSDDAMTADWARLPHELLARISNRIVNEIPEANRVVYDITSKPPATIEWE